MRHSSLSSFLDGELPASDLWRQIEPEVIQCLAACAKGGSGQVILNDGPDTLVLREHVAVLLTALAGAELPLDAASYIADALIMGESFNWKDEAVADVLFRLSDESAPLTSGDLEWARSRLATT